MKKLVCPRFKAKARLLVLQGFSWDFSKRWCAITRSPGMTESQTYSIPWSPGQQVLQQHTETAVTAVPSFAMWHWNKTPGDKSSLEKLLIQMTAPISTHRVVTWAMVTESLGTKTTRCTASALQSLGELSGGKVKHKCYACAFHFLKRASVETTVRRPTRSWFK